MAGDGVTKAEKATVQPGRWTGAATARGGPHGDVVLGASGVADCPLSTKMAIHAAPLLGATLLTALYTEMATTALVSPV